MTIVQILCEICKKQAEIISRQDDALEQLGAVVDEEERAEVAELAEMLKG